MKHTTLYDANNAKIAYKLQNYLGSMASILLLNLRLSIKKITIQKHLVV